MFWLVESQEQLSGFKKIIGKEAFIEIIPYNPFIHSAQNSICAIYIRPINHKKGWILCLNHTEAFKLDKEKTLQHLFNNVDKMFVPQKKEALYHFPHPEKLYDINFIEYINFLLQVFNSTV
jgi:hypothetical protein